MILGLAASGLAGAAPAFASKKLPLVMIDPGHGGHDPGAIAPDGTFEKDITLATGLTLRRSLLATGRYRVGGPGDQIVGREEVEKYIGDKFKDGADRIRYLSPVPAGSRIRGRTTIAEANDVPPDGLRVNYHMVIEIEGSERPACVAELIALHYR